MTREVVGQHEPDRPVTITGFCIRKAFSPTHLEEAAGIALARHSTSYHFVKSLCEALRNTEGNTHDILTQEHELIRSLDEYQNHVNQRMN